MSEVKVSSHSLKNRPSTYIAGYIMSVYLTVTAYLLVKNHMGTKWLIAFIIAGLALVQFIIQLLFFLHLGRESRPRTKLLVFGFMTLVVLILVVGSLWIMSSLNYRMTPQQINNYLKQQTEDGL